MNRLLKIKECEDEYELVEGIIEGMNNRGKKNNHEVERFTFN